jgi:hypothetical protein
LADRIPYKGRSLEVFMSGNVWIVEIVDMVGRRSIVNGRTIEVAINTAYQMIDSEEARITER